MNLDELLKSVNCSAVPDEWVVHFPRAVEEYNDHGCIYAYPEYYEMLDKKYDMFGDMLPVYQKAASAIKGDKSFELFLLFIAISLRESEAFSARQRMGIISRFSRPIAPDGSDDIKYDMLPALAICTQADTCYKNLISHGLPDDFISTTMRILHNGVRGFRLRHNGHDGYDLLGWFQLVIGGELFEFDNLQAGFALGFYGDAAVFSDGNEIIALSLGAQVHSSGNILGAKNCTDTENSFTATYAENETAYIGHPFDEDGYILPDTVTLDKSKWKKIIDKNDPVIALHIPAKRGLSPESVDVFFKTVIEFFEKYYPEYEYKAFTCGSWLMDSQLKSLLSESSNIVSFQNRFRKIRVCSQGESVFRFAFNCPDANVDVPSLPEDTSLQRAIKNHYLNGKAIYEVLGFIPR